MNLRLRHLTALARPAAVAAAAAGCSPVGGGPVPVTPAKGKVVYQGKPAASAMLYFVPADATPESIRPRALTDAKGEYELNVYGGKVGAPEGEYAVTVTWPGPGGRPKLAPGEEDNGQGADFFKGKFADPRTTPFRATIKAGTQELPPIVLPAQ